MQEYVWNDQFKAVEFINEGQAVWLRVGTDAVRCSVAIAAGYHARVINVKRDIDRWVHIRDLRSRIT